MKLEIEVIRRAASAADRIKDIDSTIRRMGESIENNAAKYGDSVRRIVGCNLLSQFTDSHLGEVVFCAIVNALLDERASIVVEFSDIVEFSPPPCPRQTPSSNTEQ